MKEKDNKELEELTADMPKKKLPVWSKIVIGVVIALLAILGIAYGVFSYNYGKIYVKDNDNEKAQEEYFDEDTGIENLKAIDPDKIHLDSADSVMQSKDVINILVCGEEAIGGGRGRTDSIMIATVNRKDGALRLTSIMRDTYVQIPGFSDNKINAAYHNGGMKTLIKTIHKNFGVDVDGYVLVNFDSFQQVIEALGALISSWQRMRWNILIRPTISLRNRTGHFMSESIT